MAFCLVLRAKAVLGFLTGRLAAWYEESRLIQKRFVPPRDNAWSFTNRSRSTGPKMANLSQLHAKTHFTFCDFQERTTSQLYSPAKLKMMELKRLSKLSQISTRGSRTFFHSLDVTDLLQCANRGMGW